MAAAANNDDGVPLAEMMDNMIAAYNDDGGQLDEMMGNMMLKDYRLRSIEYREGLLNEHKDYTLKYREEHDGVFVEAAFNKREKLIDEKFEKLTKKREAEGVDQTTI